jgi:hypothetical protein
LAFFVVLVRWIAVPFSLRSAWPQRLAFFFAWASCVVSLPEEISEPSNSLRLVWPLRWAWPLRSAWPSSARVRVGLP